MTWVAAPILKSAGRFPTRGFPLSYDAVQRRLRGNGGLATLLLGVRSANPSGEL